MKGVTPIIAIILLLLITISLVGFTYVWFSRIQQQLASGVEQQTATQLKNQGTSVRIDSIDKAASPCGIVYVRNMGTQIAETAKLTVYKNGITPVSCTWDVGANLNPGGVAKCTVASCLQGAAQDLEDCTSVKVSSVGIGDIETCPS